MLKIIGMVMIIGSCTAAGMSVRNSYRSRITAIKSFISALELIRSEIVCKARALPELFPEAIRYSEGAAKAFLEKLKASFSAKMPFYELCRENLSSLRKTGLKKEDIAEINEAFSAVGRYDAVTSDEKIKASLSRLSEHLKNAEEECAKNGKVSMAVGVAAGVMLAVLLL